MGQTFSRLECRDILANVGAGVDPDVLAKLQAGAEQVRVTSVPHAPAQQQLEATPVSAVNVESQGVMLLTLTPDMQRPRADGLPTWTQDDVDTVNAQRVQHWHTQERMRMRKPIVGEANADNINADFAPPDVHTLPKETVALGMSNSGGDKCVALNDNGESVFSCAQGHAYTHNALVRGCPTCFAEGITTVGITMGTRRADPDDIPGEESF